MRIYVYKVNMIVQTVNSAMVCNITNRRQLGKLRLPQIFRLGMNGGQTFLLIVDIDRDSCSLYQQIADPLEHAIISGEVTWAANRRRKFDG